MAKNKDIIKEHYKIISIKVLSERAGIDYQKVYNTLARKEPLYNTMDENDKKKLANTLFNDVCKIFKELGADIGIKKKS